MTFTRNWADEEALKDRNPWEIVVEMHRRLRTLSRVIAPSEQPDEPDEDPHDQRLPHHAVHVPDRKASFRPRRQWLVGKGGGSICSARHVRLRRETPLYNLWLAMVDRMGAPTQTLGDSTGLLESLS